MKISHVKNKPRPSSRRLVCKFVVGSRGLVLNLSPALLLASLLTIGVVAHAAMASRATAEAVTQAKLRALELDNQHLQTFLTRQAFEKRQMVNLADSRSVQLQGELNARDREMDELWRVVGKHTHESPSRRRSLTASRSGAHLWMVKRRFLELSGDLHTREREMVALRSAAESFRVARHRRARAEARIVAMSNVPSIWPCQGVLSSNFGYRMHPVLGYARFHAGIDVAADYGCTIVATAGGRVTSAGWMSGYGNAVTIDHGRGISTLYGHCSSVSVRAGQQVRQGDSIANVGSTGLSTGPHCHYEVHRNGSPVNPSDYLRSIH
jgi:murein DD-endopeptidase MepM/ murein hydrolase activator NlpD